MNSSAKATNNNDQQMQLSWSPETIASMLAQPCYSDAEARAKLRDKPHEVVATLAKNLHTTFKDHPAAAKLETAMKTTLDKIDVVVHENTADTWNIVIPSEQTLALEEQNPILQNNGTLQDDALEKISAGEIVIATSILGTAGLGTATIAIFSPLVVAAIAGVGASAAATLFGSVGASLVAGGLLTKSIGDAQNVAGAAAGKKV